MLELRCTENGNGRVNGQTAAKGTGGGVDRADRDTTNAQEGAEITGAEDGGTEGAGDRGVEAEDMTAAAATEYGTGRVNEQTATKGTGGGANRVDRDSTNEHVDIFEKEPIANCG